MILAAIKLWRRVVVCEEEKGKWEMRKTEGK